jgi:hypothetical protein
MLRGFIWTVLLVGGAASVGLAVLVSRPAVAVATGIVAVGTWIAWGVFSTWHWSLRRRLAEHLGPGWRKAVILNHKVKTAERVNIQAALDHLLSQMGSGEFVFGYTAYSPMDEEFVGTAPPMVHTILHSNLEPVPIRWESMPRSETQALDCAENALYLLRTGDQAFAVAVQGQSNGARKRAVLHVIARDRPTARAAIDDIVRLSYERSVYRGQVITVQKQDAKSDDFVVDFHPIAAISRESIILPEEVLRSIERNVLGFFHHAAELKQAGQGTRHGVLLHGPPGTGKTLITRYLAGSVSPATVILLTGRQYAFLKSACMLARLLAPTLMVLEDVDLIAADRRRNRHAPLLHELMDEMDGLGTMTDVVFLLTTNQPEALEAALAGRPGRVDQAIYFPLPDIECRRKLIQEFGKNLDMGAIDIEPLLARTEGASPAFIKELFRRATLLALQRAFCAAPRAARSNSLRKPVALTSDDFTLALRELVESGGELTRSFLGFPTRTG